MEVTASGGCTADLAASPIVLNWEIFMAASPPTNAMRTTMVMRNFLSMVKKWRGYNYPWQSVAWGIFNPPCVRN